MAWHVDTSSCAGIDIDATMTAVIAAATITTWHHGIITKISDDKFLCTIIYE